MSLESKIEKIINKVPVEEREAVLERTASRYISHLTAKLTNNPALLKKTVANDFEQITFFLMFLVKPQHRGTFADFLSCLSINNPYEARR